MQDCYTPLHYAAFFRHHEVARALIDAGADPNMPDDVRQQCHAVRALSSCTRSNRETHATHFSHRRNMLLLILRSFADPMQITPSRIASIGSFFRFVECPDSGWAHANYARSGQEGRDDARDSAPRRTSTRLVSFNARNYLLWNIYTPHI